MIMVRRRHPYLGCNDRADSEMATDAVNACMKGDHWHEPRVKMSPDLQKILREAVHVSDSRGRVVGPETLGCCSFMAARPKESCD
jgi:hypothetical protein